MVSSGLFIVLEGIDGCGKTTIARRLAKILRAQKIKVLMTREPTSQTAAGKEIHAILRGQHQAPEPLVMQRLYITDRQIHTAKVIKPALEKNQVVICQRYALSTLAYGTAFGVNKKDLQHKFIKPDFTFLLDVPAEIAMQRIGKRKQGLEYFEKIDRLTKIAQKYQTLAKDPYFGKVNLIDAKPLPKVIIEQILGILKI